MYFDILASEHISDSAVVLNYGEGYLQTKGQDGQPLTSKECRFFHIESVRSVWEETIKRQGYFIIEMKNCTSIITVEFIKGD